MDFMVKGIYGYIKKIILNPLKSLSPGAWIISLEYTHIKTVLIIQTVCSLFI